METGLRWWCCCRGALLDGSVAPVVQCRCCQCCCGCFRRVGGMGWRSGGRSWIGRPSTQRGRRASLGCTRPVRADLACSRCGVVWSR
ncbi:MAG: hypothetical protein BYD32DRAFT_429896 [Podila humilis]|nr:MAG: hypothetical protein BYD32DRAFT_429896 [Podila humilis]